MGITRRDFVVQGTAMATAAMLFGKSQGKKSLGGAGISRGILAGCAVQPNKLRSDTAYADLVRAQARILVGENTLKFESVHPGPTTYFFDDADYLATFAETNGMKLRGHNFVWHRALPDWFTSAVTSANAEQVLVDHINTVAGRYAGRIHSWDVVNEAIDPKDGLADGLRDSPWQKVLPGYIDIAFHAARKADPKALLVYNDYGIEAENTGDATKREAVLNLLRGMQKRGVPVDALGVQSHLSANKSQVYGPGLVQLIAQARSMGLKVLLTEMDVNDRSLPPDTAARDEAVAQTYGSYLQTALADPAVIALLTWGITDKYTWLNGEDSRADRLPERPLLFDSDLKPKSAFDATVKALHGAPKRK